MDMHDIRMLASDELSHVSVVLSRPKHAKGLTNFPNCAGTVEIVIRDSVTYRLVAMLLQQTRLSPEHLVIAASGTGSMVVVNSKYFH